MPFLSRCKDCGHLVWAQSLGFLRSYQSDHDRKAHRVESWRIGFKGWLTTTLTKREYDGIDLAHAVSSFWSAIRRPLFER